MLFPLKKEILSFLTIWMTLEDIMLSKISRSQTNGTQCHGHVEYKEGNFIRVENRKGIIRV